jgi:hypothetical protein
MKMSLPAFCKQYRIDIKKVYKLIERADTLPGFLKKEGDRWTANNRGSGVRTFIAEYGDDADRETENPAPPKGDRREVLREAREKKALAESRIKEFKAEQEEIKTKAMIGEYIDVSLMGYYFSFFQRVIKDSYSAIKPVSADLEKLYVAGQHLKAETLIKKEIQRALDTAMAVLAKEIEKDEKSQ